MNPLPRAACAIMAVALAVSSSATAHAAEAPSSAEPSSRATAVHFDAEVDPTAYALSGYSLHLGVGYGRARLDLGAYAMNVPRFVHGNDAFDVSFGGFGIKAQYFVLSEQRGLFAGVDAGPTRVLIERRDTSLAARQDTLGVGVNAGYRFALPAGFYVTPWIGVGYGWGFRDVTFAGATYKSSPVTVFPAVHLGYAFE